MHWLPSLASSGCTTLGPNMISIFIIFALLYWVGMARIVRSQILILKESEYVTAARALALPAAVSSKSTCSPTALVP